MRCSALPVLLLALVVPVSTAEDPADTDEPKQSVTLEEWCIGQSRGEIVELLGKPKNTKKRKGMKVFLYAWDGSAAQAPVFPGSGPYVTSAPLPIAASPQPSDAEAVGGSKAPPLPPNLQELKDSWDPEASDWETRKSLEALEITFGDDDRVSSCRMVPRKNKKSAKKSKSE